MARDPATNPSPLRIATRESPLAMWQAEYVAAELGRLGHVTRLVPLVSGGDVDLRPIDGTRQVGVFTKRIQQALVDDEADIAVHSLKDLPTADDPRFTLAAVPPRASVLDCWVSDRFASLEELPRGGSIGTGSTRRIAQLRSLRPDVVVHPLRGNVQTRLGKLASGELDAIILAQAGLGRLGMTDRAARPMPLAQMLPAPGQGALGIETRRGDLRATAAAASLDHWPTHAAVVAERSLLASLHGGCLAPIAALATWSHLDASDERPTLQLTSLVLSADGETRVSGVGERPLDRDGVMDAAMLVAIQLGQAIAAQLRNAGAAKLIEAARH